ncbi:hypothetical protein MMK78_006200 [Raoultella planticola]|nr:hypothetical protein [Raoultella planticola]EIY2679263.1 hypothetical protein [Raoultella planticola]
MQNLRSDMKRKWSDARHQLPVARLVTTTVNKRKRSVLDQLTTTGTSIAWLLKFWCSLFAGNPETGFNHKRPDGFFRLMPVDNILTGFESVNFIHQN